ncbi:MAG: formate dehydrogenase-N subunit alpha, partial [Planctomycetes bacterium]|nr:formate dehydrogenase-N subunit alpha [Planctomycetota bacterium]
ANGAKLISVDPRFTRTASKADIYAPLRSGTDIAFLGGMLKYILDNDLIQREYATEYTNAGFLVNAGFKFSDGLFSGYDAAKRKYDKSAWKFQTDGAGVIKKDKSLKDPRCVYQLLKKHYARYDLNTVSGITGTPKDKLEQVYQAYVQACYKPGTAGTIMYAMGWTQHTVGAQNIRAMSMIQLLLGNIGAAGGGVNALRGESNVQGSTDHCLLFHILPGYLKTPEDAQATLADYNAKWTPTTVEPRSANWWGNYPKYIVSFLTSMYGQAATAKNDFGYAWLPKRDAGANYAWQPMFDAMYRKELKGFFAWGQNPAGSSANANKVRQALAQLDWLVAVNIFPTETAEFWHGPGMDPKEIKTEVFQLPAAASVEKEGSITNSGRWAQWRYQAVNPPGAAKPDAEIINELFLAVKALYAAGGAFPDPILNLKWDYFDGPEVPARLLAKEVNGYYLADAEFQGKQYKQGDLVPSFAALMDDGTTSSGNWLYCNSYVDHDFAKGNKMARTKRETSGIGLNPEWSWCWPVNRRIIYNRASVDLQGNPYDAEHPVIAWKDGKWVGDVPDGGWPPMKNPDGTDNDKAKLPFIMRKNGVAQVFGDLADGPVPEHYEPLESPLAKNPMGHSQRLNPAVFVPPAGEMNAVAVPGDSEYPIVCSSYRVVEHWQTGVMTRWVPWLNELQPEMFVEMSEELAAKKRIKNGERVKVRSARGEVQAVAIVTKRFKPFKIKGNTVHQVGVPWCFGWVAPEPDNTRATSANLLTPNVGDPNTRIPESKAFMVDVVKEA